MGVKNWGGNAFPTATGVSNGDNIKVYKASVYNITFNRVTGKYTFVDTNLVGYHTISIIGNSTPGGWDTDTPMTTTNGVNYNINGVSLVSGALKFRMGNDWATSWGGNYPSGNNSIGGNDIPIPNSSVYNITLNISTGAYTIRDIRETQIRQCGRTLRFLNEIIQCQPIAGATQYRFQVTDEANVVTVVTSGNFTFNPAAFTFDHPTNRGFNWAKNYIIRAAIYINGDWGAYGPSCTARTPNEPAALPTKLRSPGFVTKQ
ncbi:hypothetical protein ACFQZF_01710 [Flavobacterium myungsuense]|uniref:hypothetical protein n=1 Tax=Flavobacterium myungsuense TaxID=651823 RepID=UPI00362C80FC